ncbi:holin family protein [Paenisporosarcina sp. OV554]|uniref:phage holin family protein n=1 Tax=Paenisporosarcina sp. OV554 TaxID=2135694 RepID=UPI0021064152|nr:phage holin family protein [Paenisporosarcina sp. OV554]
MFIIEKIIFAISVLGTWFLFLIGGWQLLLTILAVFMLIDIATGIINALIKRKLTSEIGYKGFLKKATIMLVIILANWLDMLTISEVPVFKTIAIYFYIGMEGLSIIENLNQIGVPIPKAITKYIDQIAKEEEPPNKKE